MNGPARSAFDGTTPLSVLLVDDEATSLEALSLCVEALGHRVHTASSAREALRSCEAALHDLALVDLRLGADSGLDLVGELVQQSPWLKVAVITAHGSIETAVEAMRRGAMDYLEKPVSPAKLEAITRQISTLRDLEDDIERLREDLALAVPPPRVQTANRAMREVYALARRAAASDATILVRGESGTGKGVLARGIHDWSARSRRPFSIVSTPSLSRELLESELFGHVKGAFTGAVRSRAGRISRTDGGTLLLDEIGAMPIELQPKLLRFLQDRSYERVGGDTTLTADVRVIVATNRDLEKAVEDGDFREDLYFRIRVIEIAVPPLRDRPEDILPLAEAFVEFFGARYGKPGAYFTDTARRELVEREWPGNVRELQNAVERAVILAAGTQVGAGSLPAPDRGRTGARGATPLITLDEAEKRHLRGVLEAAGSGREAAKILGISPTTLWRRRRKHDI
ncbi:MAG TPA: sigma-54 dependent transcriptional regulator [Longimicrobiales bacterium]|nr:sigma-54 dependent transcriptional regulator [Longimicrobiales bacterium]